MTDEELLSEIKTKDTFTFSLGRDKPQKSVITWHHYPSEKPKEGHHYLVRYCLIDEPYEDFFLGKKWSRRTRVIDGKLVTTEVLLWAEMPKDIIP